MDDLGGLASAGTQIYNSVEGTPQATNSAPTNAAATPTGQLAKTAASQTGNATTSTGATGSNSSLLIVGIGVLIVALFFVFRRKF